MLKKKSFTLIEILIVVIIVGILASLALPNFGPFKENTLDKEAKASLSLIRAAEKIYRMENGSYHMATNTVQVNNWLRLSLPTSGSSNWGYGILVLPDGSGFTAKARRVPAGSTDSRIWCINQDETHDSYDCSSCSWDEANCPY